MLSRILDSVHGHTSGFWLPHADKNAGARPQWLWRFLFLHKTESSVRTTMKTAMCIFQWALFARRARNASADTGYITSSRALGVVRVFDREKGFHPQVWQLQASDLPGSREPMVRHELHLSPLRWSARVNEWWCARWVTCPSQSLDSHDGERHEEYRWGVREGFGAGLQWFSIPLALGS